MGQDVEVLCLDRVFLESSFGKVLSLRLFHDAKKKKVTKNEQLLTSLVPNRGVSQSRTQVPKRPRNGETYSGSDC